MSVRHLPPELDDLIIDHLYDDWRALACCALVRRSWLPRSRYHFWHELRLACSDDEMHKLIDLLL